MFNRLKNTFAKRNDEKKESSSAFDLKNVANLSSPSLPRQDGAHSSLGFFTSEIHKPGLHQMTIEVEIWPTEALTENDMDMVKAPASGFLGIGKDADKVHNYDFDSFLETFEEKLNNANPAHPTEMKFGLLGFLDLNGIYVAVGDQDSFGVALNNLYLNRGDNNILRFVFQPESEEYRRKRLEVRNEKHEARFPGSGKKSDRRETFPADNLSQIFQRYRQPERFNPFVPSDSVQDLESIQRPQTGLSAQVLHLVGWSSHAGSSSSQRRESEPTKACIAITPPSSDSVSSGKHSHIGSIKSAVHKAVKGSVKKIPETKEEERERFKSLYQEEKRVTFTRGGDDTNDDETSQKLDHTEELDGQGNDEDDEEEDDDISNEDRIVTK